MNALRVTPEYIRDERDFLTPLSVAKRLSQVLAPQAFPVMWPKGIDISGSGQTKEIADAFPIMYSNNWHFVMMRATSGIIEDVLFDYFWPRVLDAGLFPLVYGVTFPAISWQAQVDKFLAVIDPLMEKIEGHTVAVNDVEYEGDPTLWRSLVNNWHNTVSPKVTQAGVYSSIYKWQKCTNNMPLPATAFGHNASWSSYTDVQIPTGWLPQQVKKRQVGVYLKHPWVEAVPGVKEDVDVDYFMGTLDELKSFLGIVDDQPAPPPTDDTLKRLAALETLTKRHTTQIDNLVVEIALDRAKLEGVDASITKLDERITSLEEKTPPAPPPSPYAFFDLYKRVPAHFTRSDNGVGNPIFEIYPSDASLTSQRIYFSGTVEVIPGVISGDSGARMYKLAPHHVPKNVEHDLYVRKQDGVYHTATSGQEIEEASNL